MNIVLRISILERFQHQGDLAKRLGVSEAHLSRIVTQRVEPTQELKQKISEILEISEDELFANS